MRYSRRWSRGLAFLAFAVGVAIQPVGAATIDAGIIGATPYSVTGTFPVGPFSQEYTFQIAPSSGAVTLSAKDLPLIFGTLSLFNIGPLSLSLFGPPPALDPLGSDSTTGDNLLSVDAIVSPGTVYTARVSGTADGSSGGIYAFAIVALPAIPEPSTLALFCAGVVVLGAVVMRRSR